MAHIGRAELLLALRLGAGDSLALEHDERHWWGYRCVMEAEPLPEQPAGSPVPARPVGNQRTDADAPTDPLRMPLQMPVAWVLREQTSRDLPTAPEGLPRLTEADLRPLSPDMLPYRDLVPWARVLPGLRRHTDRQVAGDVDWPRLATRLARRELPRQLPRRSWQRWPQHLTLVLDFSPRLDPYRSDFHRLALQLDAHLPAASLSVRVLRHGPAGPWQTWPHPRKPAPAGDMHAWEVRHPAGAVLLFATDLGLFDEQPTCHEDWLDWARDLRAQGCRLIALAPLSPHQPTARALQLFELLRWSPDSWWRREHRAVDGPGDESSKGSDALDALLALAATAVRIDPPLLRAWRCLIPGGGDAGLEGRLWNHAHLQAADLTCATRAEYVDSDLARHATLPGAVREAAHAVHAAEHAHLRRSLTWAEALRWRTVATAREAPARWAAALEGEPLTFVKRLLHSVHDPVAPPDEAMRRLLNRAAELIQSTAGQLVRAQDPALFAELDAAVARWRSGSGFLARPAPGVDHAATRGWLLAQQGSVLALVPSDAAGTLQPLGKPVQVPASVQGAGLQSPDGSRWLALQQSGAQLASLGDAPVRLEVMLDRHAWVVEKVVRPPWATSWQQKSGVTSAAVPSPALGADGRAELVWFQHPWRPRLQIGLADGRAAVGLDGHGAYAEITLRRFNKGAARVHRAPTLRLRWIPPGRFQMGSLEGTGSADERPEHLVLISEGYWLAEGPCTQAIWQLVMGSNPSYFKDRPDAALRPVEQVSFEDVRQFLLRLRDWLPRGCAPALPTEAQWEYAARAGTRTAYPWGDEPVDWHANWMERHHGTSSVGRFPPNPWGLLDMNGNVLEWCADVPREYSNAPQRDPRGDPSGLPRRVVRGGSWIHRPSGARSACRDVWPPDLRSWNLGFRIVLRSSGPGVGGSSADTYPGPEAASAGAEGRSGSLGLVERVLSSARQAPSPGTGPAPTKKKGRR